MKLQKGFIFLVLLVLTSCGGSNKELKEIKTSEFEDMVQSRDIKKLVLVKNENQVEITLKSEALQNAKYQQDLKANGPFGMNINGPHYTIKIGSIDQFDRYYKEISEKVPRDQRVDLRYEERSDTSDILFQWGLIFIPFFGLMVWMLIRRRHSKVNKAQAEQQKRDLESGILQKATTRYRYPALRTIARIYTVCAWIIGIAAIVVAYYQAYYQSGWIAILSLVVGALIALGLVAISESIKVFIDIEFNTRKLADKN